MVKKLYNIIGAHLLCATSLVGMMVSFALLGSLCCAPGAYALVMPPQLTTPTTVINMKQAGAKGDGVTDDTKAIQTAINAAPNNTRFYFPAGTYQLNNINITNRSQLQFDGDGDLTVLQYRGVPTGYVFMMTFSGVTDLVIQNLAWDNKAIPNYGGVRFYNVKRVRIQHTHFFDSNKQPVGRGDHYAYVFGYDPNPSEDIQIVDNLIEDLQLEVDQARHVEISRNVVIRGTKTAGIGLFTLRHKAVMEDYLIAENLIIDPLTTAIAVHLDPPVSNDCLIRQIHIRNNSIIRNTSSGLGISIGAPSVNTPTTGNRFEDILIEGNVFWTNSSAPAPNQFIRALSKGNFVFDHLIVQGNVALGNGLVGPNGAGGIQIRYIKDGVIAGNALRSMQNGLGIVKAQYSEIYENIVSTTGYAYFYTSPVGQNSFQNNYYAGTPTLVFQREGAPAASDVLYPPTLVPLDTHPVQFSRVAVTDLTADTATITWETSEPSTTEVEYGLDTTYGESTYPRAPLAVSHTITLVNLAPQQLYYFRVKAIDATGQEAVSLPYTFQTTPRSLGWYD
jgi:hypothetical protein